jgi:hypothetical protein
LYLKKAEYRTFDLHVELKGLKRTRLMRIQEEEVQKIVDLFEGSRVSWHDATGHANAKDRPAIETNVQALMRNLVHVSDLQSI